ncbi:AbrB family transcriptional regulator [Aminobacter anthyllidis]|uniref:AbrB family transcriptional regulator n=1 Tax=Aminobacter anthyllidis TaxID=1035067 RepID=UPI002456EED1|nr:AbrB family transcriptional regulator [Aminobacter anthyllidis]MDH4988369.1 AbrB family transcriptional regulator [Aminobacter anthyllidis]
MKPDPQPAAPLTDTKPWLQWLLLLACSVLLAGALELVHLPAALLVGPMLVAIALGSNGATVRVPKPLFVSAQALIGCLVASSISTGIFVTFASEWPLFLSAAIATVVASSFLGWFISRLKVLPGTTAVWGSAPGAATAMVLMADAFGADARLVAFMQYLRVIMVSIAAAVIARLWVDTSGVEAPGIEWFPSIVWPAFGAMVGVAVVGGTLGYMLRIPSPYFVGAMLVGAVVHLGFGIELQLPEWLLAIGYTLIGWSIGLNFTRPILRHAARALPQVVGSIAALMAFCGVLAFGLHVILGVDPLTAYLATSPGGMDSIAIIAAASKDVDLSFVLTLQMLRFLIVLLFGPALARLVARTIKD